jgi:hypothetical protein
VGEQWSDCLQRQGQTALAFQLCRALPTIAENMQREFAGLRARFPRGYDTLNAPSLAQVCQLVEQRGLRCALIHDQCGPHERIYRYLFEHYRDMEHEIRVRRDGSHEVFGFQGLHSLEFGDSETLPLLRAADYLVAVCVEFARRAVANEAIPPELGRGAHYGFGRMMKLAAGESVRDQTIARQVGEIMASDVWIEKVARAFASLAPNKR